jgi:hypothetical protein
MTFEFRISLWPTRGFPIAQTNCPKWNLAEIWLICQVLRALSQCPLHLTTTTTERHLKFFISTYWVIKSTILQKNQLFQTFKGCRRFLRIAWKYFLWNRKKKLVLYVLNRSKSSRNCYVTKASYVYRMGQVNYFQAENINALLEKKIYMLQFLCNNNRIFLVILILFI